MRESAIDSAIGPRTPAWIGQDLPHRVQKSGSKPNEAATQGIVARNQDVDGGRALARRRVFGVLQALLAQHRDTQ